MIRASTATRIPTIPRSGAPSHDHVDDHVKVNVDDHVHVRAGHVCSEVPSRLGAVRAPLLATLALCAGACTGSAPPPPPLEMPSNEVFSHLFTRAPAAIVQLPLTLDTESCAFARYSPETAAPQPFVLIHPLRTQCELWLGRIGFVLEYCLYPREDLVEIDASRPSLFQAIDDQHCVFGADPPA
jgi:hypothetical protein